MKSTIIAVIIGVAVVLGTLFFVDTKNSVPTRSYQEGENVHMEGETQVIEIDVKGGYLPERSVAKAGMPTVIRFNTQATFDCSSSVRIPSLDVSKNLPQTGSTDIDLGTPTPGPLQGSCSMGMYPFEVIFE